MFILTSHEDVVSGLISQESGAEGILSFSGIIFVQTGGNGALLSDLSTLKCLLADTEGL